ncbi:uncharacterized protein Gasu_42150 [Galdieria sulphuraria]|uniref:Uncharacterized protein n=1 Tax=Galdieria sulphuraria TaxID=130081 RepID=M2XEJ1_GALSU|nr:uncharacterized protein Gasu_42150 [Galdieria sulphuraria]EME28377.1 hypothetical protein Gasu_42150 [Galdieria sulphuraria]|eukprot:XP_005704897.1 hypothetical protein Gasu_42150 [Galdieria sulphuraria]
MQIFAPTELRPKGLQGPPGNRSQRTKLNYAMSSYRARVIHSHYTCPTKAPFCTWNFRQLLVQSLPEMGRG